MRDRPSGRPRGRRSLIETRNIVHSAPPRRSHAYYQPGACPTGPLPPGKPTCSVAGVMTTCGPDPDHSAAKAVVPHGPWVVLQLTLVAVPRALFAEILRRVERLLRPRPPFSA